MAHPKSKISKQRKRKRRTHQKATAPTLTTCKTSGEVHRRHTAYYDEDGNMLYRGKVLIAAEEELD